jgi:hypothetical protein
MRITITITRSTRHITGVTSTLRIETPREPCFHVTGQLPLLLPWQPIGGPFLN